MKEKLTSVYKTSAPPFPTGIMANSYILPMIDSLGIDENYGVLYALVTKKNHDWHFIQDKIEDLPQKVLNALIKDPGIIEKNKKKYLENINELKIMLNIETLEGRFNKMSDQDLIEFLNKSFKLYRAASYYVEPVGFSMEIGGQNIVKSEFKEHLSENNFELKQSELNDNCAILSSFTQLSFIQEAEMELLKIASLDQNDRDDSIKQYESDYYWQYYDYLNDMQSNEIFNHVQSQLHEDIKQLI